MQQMQLQGRGIIGADMSARGNVVKLPAYQNDVLHALMETGGLPGSAPRTRSKCSEQVGPTKLPGRPSFASTGKWLQPIAIRVVVHRQFR